MLGCGNKNPEVRCRSMDCEYCAALCTEPKEAPVVDSKTGGVYKLHQTEAGEFIKCVRCKRFLTNLEHQYYIDTCEKCETKSDEKLNQNDSATYEAGDYGKIDRRDPRTDINYKLYQNETGEFIKCVRCKRFLTVSEQEHYAISCEDCRLEGMKALGQKVNDFKNKSISPRFTLMGFRFWFAGFCSGITDTPNAEQWAELKDRIREIEDKT